MSKVHIGKKVNSDEASELTQMFEHLVKDDKLVAIFNTGIAHRHLLITQHRILKTKVAFSGGQNLTDEIFGDEIQNGELESIRWSKTCTLKIQSNDKTKKYTTIFNDEAELILSCVKKVSGKATPYEIIDEKRKQSVIEKNKEIDEEIKASQDEWKKLIIGSVNKPSLEEVRKSCTENEKPIKILGELGGGVLAIFEDRCIIIKKGLGTSLFASSLGGGRVTTFYYRDINSIEYNSGMVQGVLEILTPSYQGGGSNSVWAKRGASNNAFELANTLPWTKGFYESVRSEIDYMRKKINESKSHHVNSVISNISIADELSKLSEIHKSGGITDEEYDILKKKLIN